MRQAIDHIHWATNLTAAYNFVVEKPVLEGDFCLDGSNCTALLVVGHGTRSQQGLSEYWQLLTSDRSDPARYDRGGRFPGDG